YNTDSTTSFLIKIMSTWLLANTILLLFHILIFILQHKLKLTHLLIGLLALTYLVMLLMAGFIDVITCKSLIYVHRVVRGLSNCTTCLPRIIQVTNISPRNSRIAKFKHKSFYSNCQSPLNLSYCHPNLTSDNITYVTESCSLLSQSYYIRHTFSILLTFRETFFMGIMVFSGGYMITLLCRHRKQSQHLHSISLSAKASLEPRATQTSLLLMNFFMVISILETIITYSRIMLNDDPILYNIQILVSHSYGTVSSLVFISALTIKGQHSWGWNTSRALSRELSLFSLSGTFLENSKGLLFILPYSHFTQCLFSP
uniref:Vomeronasal type-1 receptor n=1 Tax=Castor canadensis TaxID=51338 RepID=A0A8C0WR93_CASCN